MAHLLAVLNLPFAVPVSLTAGQHNGGWELKCKSLAITDTINENL